MIHLQKLRIYASYASGCSPVTWRQETDHPSAFPRSSIRLELGDTQQRKKAISSKGIQSCSAAARPQSS